LQARVEHRPDEIKVLFLAGKGRSGGTILASLLGQLPGFFNAGELNKLWDYALMPNYQCGCGEPLRSCETWSAILAEADRLYREQTGAPLLSEGVGLAQASVVRWPKLPRLLRMSPGTTEDWPALDTYTNAISATCRAIAKVTGACVIVDSSRLPFEPIALGLVPSVDVHIAHLIRDPRAVVYSWKRVRKLTDRDTGEEFPRYSAAFSTASWTIRNLVVEMIRRRNPVSVVRYDTLASDPAGTLQRLADFVDEPAGDLGFLKSGRAYLAPTHSAGGNPVRVSSGSIAIQPDEEWREHLSRHDRVVGTALALPLLHRYGLSVRTH